MLMLTVNHDSCLVWFVYMEHSDGPILAACDVLTDRSDHYLPSLTVNLLTSTVAIWLQL